MATLANPRGLGRRTEIPLDRGWQAAASPPGERSDPATLDGLTWIPATVPGTAAGARRTAGLPPGAPDREDWWFRTTFAAAPAAPGERVTLHLDGLATLAEVHLNGRPILRSESMFQGHTVDVGALLQGTNTLAIRFEAIEAHLEAARRPRARWRTRLVANNNLRWFRTTLIGRIPGFAPGPAVVGPWRPIRVERVTGASVVATRLRARIEDGSGILDVGVRIAALTPGATVAVRAVLDGPSGRHTAELSGAVDGSDWTGQGHVVVPTVARWWPHTHGEPVLHHVGLEVTVDGEPATIPAGRVGFRSLASGGTPDHDLDRDGLFVHVNETPVFVRGALWTPLDAVTLTASPATLRAALETVREAGMNMLRLPGFGVYETEAFHDLCDELGILVWQDLMFASMDYPFAEPSFSERAAAEVGEVAGRLARHPSTTVLCGGSEIEQQVAMLGLDLKIARIPFFDERVPAIALAAGLDSVYVTSAPSGGPLPIRPDRGVSNYYAVGGYRAPLSDARTSGVRFASECLAFANVPNEDVLEALVPEPPGDAFVHHPRWKAGVARDSGSGWDFDDLRDDYLAMLFGVEPRTLRRGGHDRYVELSRAVSGEVMAAVFGEWRRAASPSGGGLILWLRDLVPGAGWGVVDHRGEPKEAYHHLRRALAPRAVWLVDEGIGGLVAHVANDRPEPLRGRLRIALYADLELRVAAAEVALDLAGHGDAAVDLEAALGRFVDISWAYRFGPPAQDVVVVGLEVDGAAGPELVSQAFHFPAGRPLVRESETRLGLRGVARSDGPGRARLAISARRLTYDVRIHVPGFRPSDDAFSVEPGGRREIELRAIDPEAVVTAGSLTALNASGRVAIAIER